MSPLSVPVDASPDKSVMFPEPPVDVFGPDLNVRFPLKLALPLVPVIIRSDFVAPDPAFGV